ncbi:MAG: nitrate reductase, partial [Acidobacteria bacterium]|nr:nitrate reductase [Acidobacteriota bacterium]
MIGTFKRLIGIDNLASEYAFGRDASTGYTSAKKIPEKWVATTCGYCSVGCGIEVGVKEGKAIAARPLQGHPVNRGKLCPKGLSEHYIIDAENRAKYPLLKKNGKFVRISWDEAIATMVEKFRAVQQRYGADSLGVISTG